MKNKLVIFDMDGVISDTQKFHGQVELDILHSYGIYNTNPKDNMPITINRISENFAGVQLKEQMKQLFKIHKKTEIFDINQVEKQKAHMLNELYKQKSTKIDFIPGAEKLIKNLSKSDIRTAVVTASTRECMLLVLSKLGILKNFNNLTSIYDIDPKTNKPYTSKGEADVYNNIKENLKIDKFIMIEDGRTGMIGAQKAGGIPIAVHGKNIEENRFPEAKKHIHDLSELTFDEIISLLR